MRKLFIGLLISLVFCACQKKKDVAVEVVVKDKAYEGVSFYLTKMDTTLQLSAEGKASVVLPVDELSCLLINGRIKRFTWNRAKGLPWFGI